MINFTIRIFRTFGISAMVIFLIASLLHGAAYGASPDSIFAQDPNALVILSKSKTPKRDTVYYTHKLKNKFLSGPKKRRLQEKFSILIYYKPRHNILRQVGYGYGIIVIGKKQYDDLFGGIRQDWRFVQALNQPAQTVSQLQSGPRKRAPKINSIFAQDPNAWLIVWKSFKSVKLKKSEWMKAIGMRRSCGIACFDAYVSACNRRRDRAYRDETIKIARAQLSSQAFSTVMKHYDKRYQRKSKELRRIIWNRASRLRMCAELKRHRWYLKSQRSAKDPVVRYIKQTGHPKFVKRNTHAGRMRTIFYSFGPAEGGTSLTPSYSRKIEKKHNLVIYYKKREEISSAVNSRVGFLVRGKKQFDAAFRNVPHENLHFIKVESETSAMAVVKRIRSKLKFKIPSKPVSKQKLAQIKAAAQAGDANSQFALGIIHGRGELAKAGDSRSQIYDSATYWFEKAAAQGHMYAQTQLAGYHYNGRGRLKRNAKIARSLFEKSAKQGDALAMLNLGVIYQDGRFGIKYNYDIAKSWYFKAEQAGDWYKEAGIAAGEHIAKVARRAYKRMRKQQIYRNRAARSTGSLRCDTIIGISCNAGIDMMAVNIMLGK